MVFPQLLRRSFHEHARKHSLKPVSSGKNLTLKSTKGVVSFSSLSNSNSTRGYVSVLYHYGPPNKLPPSRKNHVRLESTSSLLGSCRFSSTWNWSSTKIHPESNNDNQDNDPTKIEMSADAKTQKEILDSCAELYRSVMPLNDKVSYYASINFIIVVQVQMLFTFIKFDKLNMRIYLQLRGPLPKDSDRGTSLPFVFLVGNHSSGEISDMMNFIFDEDYIRLIDVRLM